MKILRLLFLAGYVIFCFININIWTTHKYEWMLNDLRADGNPAPTLCDLPLINRTPLEIAIFSFTPLAILLAWGLYGLIKYRKINPSLIAWLGLSVFLAVSVYPFFSCAY